MDTVKMKWKGGDRKKMDTVGEKRRQREMDTGKPTDRSGIGPQNQRTGPPLALRTAEPTDLRTYGP